MFKHFKKCFQKFSVLQYDDDPWVPWIERSILPIQQNFDDINNKQKRLMVPMPKIKLPDLSKLKLQDSFMGEKLNLSDHF